MRNLLSWAREKVVRAPSGIDKRAEELERLTGESERLSATLAMLVDAFKQGLAKPNPHATLTAMMAEPQTAVIAVHDSSGAERFRTPCDKVYVEGGHVRFTSRSAPGVPIEDAAFYKVLNEQGACVTWHIVDRPWHLAAGKTITFDS